MKGGIKGVRELNGQTNISVTSIIVGTSGQNRRVRSWIRGSSGRSKWLVHLRKTLRDWTTDLCFTCQGSLVTSDSEGIQKLHLWIRLIYSKTETLQYSSQEVVTDWDGGQNKIDSYSYGKNYVTSNYQGLLHIREAWQTRMNRDSSNELKQKWFALLMKHPDKTYVA